MSKTVPDRSIQHAALAAGLRAVADLVELTTLPLPRHSGQVISIGALDSRADLDAWADRLGAEVRMDDASGIPYLRHRISAALELTTQAPAELPAGSDGDR